MTELGTSGTNTNTSQTQMKYGLYVGYPMSQCFHIQVYMHNHYSMSIYI